MQKKLSLNLNLKSINYIIKNTFFYIFSFVISFVFFKSIPIGAISIFTLTYASGFILTPNIIISSFGIILSGNIWSLLVFLFYILLFIAFTILIKPLVAVHDIYEKLNVEKYLFFILFYLNLFILNFSDNIFCVLITFALYKFFVNTLPMIKNEDNKFVFSFVEISAFYLLFIFITQFICFYLNTKFKLDLTVLFYISSILSCIFITISFLKTDLNHAFIMLILSALSSVMFFNVFLNTNTIILNILFISILQIVDIKKRNLFLVFGIYNILVIAFTIYFKDYLSAFMIFFSNIFTFIYFYSYRLKSIPFLSILFKNNFLNSFGNHSFSYSDDPRLLYKKVYNLDKFTDFKNSFEKMSLEENIIFSEIKYNEDIIKWIFFSLNNYSSIDISKFNNVLKDNNIIIPYLNEDFKKYIYDIEEMSLICLNNSNVDSNILID